MAGANVLFAFDTAQVMMPTQLAANQGRGRRKQDAG